MPLGQRRRRWHLQVGLVGVLACLVSTLTVPTAAAGRVERPYGRLTCGPKFGVVFCPGGFVGGRDLRVPSFDGVPIDADLTLPAAGPPPYPLVVLLHGLGGNKHATESSSPDGSLDNVTLASQGWAVLSFSARGFAGSCGTAASRAASPACARGWLHLADQRYEVRDAQYLSGLLVDEGYAKPGIAVSGISYGGAQALELAMLKNRIELENGRLVPFVSPGKHIPMTVAAVYAVWPWEDYVSALQPNGRTVGAGSSISDREPIGVVKASWSTILDAAEADLGHLPPPISMHRSDLLDWQREALAGEPYPSALSAALQGLQRYHSAIGIPAPNGGPAPTAIQSGFTDSLFPVTEALRFAAQAHRRGSGAPLLEIFDDVGHAWAQNKQPDLSFDNRTGIAFLDAAVRFHRRPQTGVLVRAQTCPASAPSGRTEWAPSFSALAPAKAIITASAGQVVTSSGGDPAVAAALNATSEPLCHQLPVTAEPGTASYVLPDHRRELHVLGGVSVTATLTVTGTDPELVGRLWDVSPDGTSRQIIEMGAIRPSVNQSIATQATATAAERVEFELPPNDYVVAPGHTLELELLGRSPPFFQVSKGTFSITVSNLRATVPLA